MSKFNIYSDDMILKTKFEVNQGVFLKSIQIESFYLINISREEIVFIKEITEKEIYILNLNFCNSLLKFRNNDAVIGEIQRNFLQIIEVDGVKI